LVTEPGTWIKHSLAKVLNTLLPYAISSGPGNDPEDFLWLEVWDNDRVDWNVLKKLSNSANVVRVKVRKEEHIHRDRVAHQFFILYNLLFQRCLADLTPASAIVNPPY
jgi:hypothetical protein